LIDSGHLEKSQERSSLSRHSKGMFQAKYFLLATIMNQIKEMAAGPETSHSRMSQRRKGSEMWSLPPDVSSMYDQGDQMSL
jgi:hypothetical protein